MSQETKSRSHHRLFTKCYHLMYVTLQLKDNRSQSELENMLRFISAIKMRHMNWINRLQTPGVGS